MSVDSAAIKDLIAHGKGLAQPFEFGNKRIGLIVPEGFEFEELKDPYELAPHIRANPVFDKTKSFIEYVNKFKTSSTTIFGSVGSRVLTAIIDYHEPGAVKPCTHKAALDISYSRQYIDWVGINKKPLLQVDFADFIEEHQLDITEPDGATMLEIVTTLQSKTSIDFQSHARLNNGTISLKYNEEQQTTAGKSNQLTVPSRLEVTIPVFSGEERRYAVNPFLRVNINQGRAGFTVKFIELDDLIEVAFSDLCDRVSEATGLPILFGQSNSNR